MYLLQKLWEGYGLVSEVVTEAEIINFIDSLDYAGDDLIQFEIYDISDIAQGPKILCYKGWQPNNLIEILNPHTKEVVISGYGNDH